MGEENKSIAIHGIEVGTTTVTVETSVTVNGQTLKKTLDIDVTVIDCKIALASSSGDVLWAEDSDKDSDVVQEGDVLDETIFVKEGDTFTLEALLEFPDGVDSDDYRYSDYWWSVENWDVVYNETSTYGETSCTFEAVEAGASNITFYMEGVGKQMISVGVFEEEAETFEQDNFVYEVLENGSLRVIEYKGSAASILIPEQINDMTVTEIGVEAFMGNTALISIDIPDTVVLIKARAFKNCVSLDTITRGNGIREIEEEAFCGCGLEAFRLSADATLIETRAFADCSNLTEFSFGGLEGYLGTDYDLEALGYIVLVAEDAFDGCPFNQPVGLRAQSDTVYCYVPNPSYGDKVVLIPYVQSTVEDDTYYYLYSEDGQTYTELEEGDVSIIRNLEYTPDCDEDTYLYFRLVVGEYSADVKIEVIATEECPKCGCDLGEHYEGCTLFSYDLENVCPECGGTNGGHYPGCTLDPNYDPDNNACPECESPYDYHFRGCPEYEYEEGECGECGGRYGDHADWCMSHGEAI